MGSDDLGSASFVVDGELGDDVLGAVGELDVVGSTGGDTDVVGVAGVPEVVTSTGPGTAGSVVESGTVGEADVVEGGALSSITSS